MLCMQGIYCQQCRDACSLISWPVQAVACPEDSRSSSFHVRQVISPACSHPIRSQYDADTDRGNGAEAQNGYAAAAPQSAPGVYSQHVPEGIQPEAGSSPEADQSKLARRADHSRHISWDAAFLETAAGNGMLDSGSGPQGFCLFHQSADPLDRSSQLACGNIVSRQIAQQQCCLLKLSVEYVASNHNFSQAMRRVCMLPPCFCLQSLCRLHSEPTALACLVAVSSKAVCVCTQVLRGSPITDLLGHSQATINLSTVVLETVKRMWILLTLSAPHQHQTP